MESTEEKTVRERFVNRIRDVEKYFTERECEEISFEVDVAYVQFLKPGFLADDEAASLHFKNGILVLVVIGSNGEVTERAVTDLPPGIQMALHEPLEIMRKHCDQKLAIDCDADVTMPSREAAPKRKPKEPSNITKVKRYFESIFPRRSPNGKKKLKSDFETNIDAYIAAAEFLLARLSPAEASATVCPRRVQALCNSFLAVGDIAAIQYRSEGLFLVVTNHIDSEKLKSHRVSKLSPEMRVLVAITLPDLISQYDQEAGQKARRGMASTAKALDFSLV